MSTDRPLIKMPPLCQTHRSLLIHGAGYKKTDSWRALEVATQAVLFQGATCEKVVWEKLGGDVTRLPDLGCLACLCPDKFTKVVQVAQSKDIGAIAALGKEWLAAAQSGTDSQGAQRMTKREEKRLRQIWQILYRSNWTEKEHLKLLKRLMKRSCEVRSEGDEK